jgi:methionyl-tRNA formyltransferase
MRIVFMGSPEFAVASLKKLIQGGQNVVAVVSGPDKKRGRGSALTPTPVKASAQQHNIDVIEVEDLRSPEFQQTLTALNPDLFVVVAFRVLPREILQIPSIGSVNLHASLLPAYRGAAPIHRAVMNGETKTGLTVFFLDERVDTGKFLRQVTLDIHPDETTGELYARMMGIGADLLQECVNTIASGEYTTIDQDDSQATAAPKLFTKDCHIYFRKPAEQVHNQIRGLSPFPTAFTYVDGKRMKVFRSAVGPALELPTGKLVAHEGKLLVSCSESSTIELIEVQIEGKNATSGIAFMNGYLGEGIIL